MLCPPPQSCEGLAPSPGVVLAEVCAMALEGSCIVGLQETARAGTWRWSQWAAK